MRDKWYGDKRDIVKWGVVADLAERHCIKRVLQVAFYRPDNTYFVFDGRKIRLNIEIISYFRNLDNIKGIEPLLNLKIDVYKEIFQRSADCDTNKKFRKRYFEQLETIITSHQYPIIVLFDPDTGIAPKNFNFNHVTPDEIEQVFNVMKSKSVLILYQHAQLGNRDWQEKTFAEFKEAVGNDASVETYKCSKITYDVAFFVVEKS